MEELIKKLREERTPDPPRSSDKNYLKGILVRR